MHATGVTAARCVAALAPRCASSSPALSIWRHDALFDPSNACDGAASRASARTQSPRRRRRLTFDALPHSSRKRRCAPTARGGYPRVRGEPHLAGACPNASRRQYPRKPVTVCRCRGLLQRALSRRVTLRHSARPPLRSAPLTRDIPKSNPTTRPAGLRTPSRVSRRDRARAVAVRATYTGASRARSRSSFRRSRRFFRSDVRFLETATHTLALLISRIFFLATKEPLFSSLFPFFPKAKKTSIFYGATDGEARARVTNDMSALTLFTRCRLFLFRLPRTTTT